MTAQVRVVDQPWADRIGVYLMRRSDTAALIERPGPDGGTTDIVDPGTDPGPSLTLDDEMALALLDALAAHYRRATDTGTLRADYEAERDRVDRLMKVVMGGFTDTSGAVASMIRANSPDSSRWTPP